MAISVPNTLSDLHQMSIKLGIESKIQGSKKDGSRSKEDYIIPIREKILSDRFGTLIPEYYQILLQLKSHMLSKRIDELSPETQEEIWNSDYWYLEEKIKGIRCYLIKDKSSELHIFSREVNRKDLLPIDIIDNLYLPHLNTEKLGLTSFILDCEISSDCFDICTMLRRYGIITSSQDEALSVLLLNLNPLMSKRLQKETDFKLVFNVFDCLYVNSTWIMNETLRKRREVVSGILKCIDECDIGIRIKQTTSTNQFKSMFFSRCLSNGYEGCIAKRIDGVYIADTSRKKDGWIKIKNVQKKLESGVLNSIGDTIDAFITGFTSGEKGTICENYVYSIKVSVFIDSIQTELCEIVNMSANMRENITEVINGIPTLKPIYYNKVVELDANCSTVLQLRYDKHSDSCIMSRELFENIKRN